MGHNSVVSGHSKSTGILQVDWLSTGPLDLGRHTEAQTFSQAEMKPLSIKLTNQHMVLIPQEQ